LKQGPDDAIFQGKEEAAMVKKADAPQDHAVIRKIVDAAAALASTQPWHRISLADIAGKAGLTVGELYRHFPSRQAIQIEMLREIDRKALSAATEAGDTPRDRLFEALMRRFDALTPFKPGIKATCDDLRRGRPGVLPSAALAALHVSFAIGWYLEAAGIVVEGLGGAVRVKLVTLAYFGALRTWLEDDSEDLSRTMAALDRGLGRIWPLLGLGGSKSQADAAEPAEEDLSPGTA
jgi:AcrR family transcriptional regulator